MALGIIKKREVRERSSGFKKSLDDVRKLDPFDEEVLCKYQTDWLLDESSVVVVEKSRQIGFSYIMALKAVLDCLTDKRNFIYSSYNLQGCKTFISDVKKWALVFNLVFNTYELEPLDETDFCIFEVKFANGRSILATSSDPKNFRGKSGCTILIDEAAYREESLEDILASAFGNLIHGGVVWIGSTHCGEENDFNALCQSVAKGEVNYSHHKVTFRDAIAQGLFKRICYKSGKPYNNESQEEFIKDIYAMYGIRASEELDVIPSDFSKEGRIFSGLPIYHSGFDDKWNWVYFRYHDLAATGRKINLDAEKKGKKSKESFYSASVKVAFNTSTAILVVVDYQAEQLNPLDGDNRIIEIAVKDGKDCYQVIEQEPGSSSIKYVDIMRGRLAEKGIFNSDYYAPKMNKVTRAIPAANAAMQGQLLVLEGISHSFNDIIKRFSAKPTPLVTDITDCVSGLYDYIFNKNVFL